MMSSKEPAKRRKTDEEADAEDQAILRALGGSAASTSTGTGPHSTTFLSDPRRKLSTVDAEDAEVLKLTKPPSP
jgi:hypothetical protein